MSTTTHLLPILNTILNYFCIEQRGSVYLLNRKPWLCNTVWHWSHNRRYHSSTRAWQRNPSKLYSMLDFLFCFVSDTCYSRFRLEI
jgi:hypothetical protein